MKVETISVNIMSKTIGHASSTEVKSMKLDKTDFFPKYLAYIEDHCTKNGFDIINVSGENTRIYHLIKR